VDDAQSADMVRVPILELQNRIQSHCDVQLQYGVHANRSFNFEAIERYILSDCLRGIHLLKGDQRRQFHYSGELNVEAAKRKVATAMHQEILPRDLQDVVLSELDTPARQSEAYRLLQECLWFLASLDKQSTLDPSLPLLTFMETSLKFSTEEMARAHLKPVHPTSKFYELRIKHFNSLLECLIDGRFVNGVPAEVNAVYRAKFPNNSPLKNALIEFCRNLQEDQFSTLMKAIKELILKVGMEPTRNQNQQLLDSFSDISVERNQMLGEQPWIADFPAEIRLSLLVDTYDALKAYENGEF